MTLVKLALSRQRRQVEQNGSGEPRGGKTVGQEVRPHSGFRVRPAVTSTAAQFASQKSLEFEFLKFVDFSFSLCTFLRIGASCQFSNNLSLDLLDPSNTRADWDVD